MEKTEYRRVNVFEIFRNTKTAVGKVLKISEGPKRSSGNF